MCSISDNSGFDSDSSPSWDVGDSSEDFKRQDPYQALIDKANSIPFSRILSHYNLVIDYNNKICCPFKWHRNGRERTPSLTIYPDTNSFFCWGCKAGSRICDFVAGIEKCNKVIAAGKVLKIFENEVDDEELIFSNSQNCQESLEILIDFANQVREFRLSHPNNEKADLYIEKYCQKFDELNFSLKLDNEAMKRLVDLLKIYISLYHD